MAPQYRKGTGGASTQCLYSCFAITINYGMPPLQSLEATMSVSTSMAIISV